MSELFKRVEKRSKTHLHNIMQLAIFTLKEGRRYGINVSKILSFEDARRYPLLRSSGDSLKNGYLVGFIEYQGRAIPVLSLEKWLGFGGEEEENRVLLVCEYSHQILALPIQEIENIHNVPIHSLQKPEISLGEAFTYSVILTLKNQEESILILDIERLLMECGLVGEGEEGFERVNGSKEIWVAEDSASAREALRSFLEKIGLEARFFGDGEELIGALEQMEHPEEIGLVLTDLEMPRMDGYQVILSVRSQKNLEKIPLWVYSSMSNKGVMEKVKSLGAEGLITKGDYPALYAMLVDCLKINRETLQKSEDSST